MTDPASARRQLDELTDLQINTLKQPAQLDTFDLLEFQLRAAEMHRLVKELESKPTPWPVRRKPLHPSL